MSCRPSGGRRGNFRPHVTLFATERSPIGCRTDQARRHQSRRGAIPRWPDDREIMPQAPHYQRVLLKLSGEALMGRREFGLDSETVSGIARDIGDVGRYFMRGFRGARCADLRVRCRNCFEPLFPGVE